VQESIDKVVNPWVWKKVNVNMPQANSLLTIHM